MTHLEKLLKGKTPFWWNSNDEKKHKEMFDKIFTEGYNEGIKYQSAENVFDLEPLLKSCWNAARHWQNGSSDKNLNDFLETVNK